MTSALTHTLNERLAIVLNRLDPAADASHLTMGFGELLERIHTAAGGAPASRFTTSLNTLITGIRNVLSDDADLSTLTTAPDIIFRQALELLEAAEPWTPPLGPGDVEPYAYIGFSEGRYWLNGATAGVYDVCQQDLENASYYGTFSEADVHAGQGWTPTDEVGIGGVTFAADIIAWVVANGATIVLETTQADDTYMELGLINYEFNDPYYYADIAGTSGGTVHQISGDGGFGVANGTPTHYAVGDHKTAITFIEAGVSASWDGNVVSTHAGTGFDTATPDVCGIDFSAMTGVTFVRSVAIYPAADDATLPQYAA